jgi:hypothetical protein
MAAAVINATCPVAPRTPDSPIFLDATSIVVTSTPCLGWQPAPAAGAGPARSFITQAQALKAFSARCSISRTPANMVAAAAANPLTLCLGGACWTRIFTELAASGLFATVTFDDLVDLEEALRGLSLATPANLEVIAGDWALAPPFALPAGGGAAAVAQRASLGRVRFFSLVQLLWLEGAAPPATPWLLIADLAGMLGPCLTQLARASDTSQVQLMAAFLTSHPSMAHLATDGARAADLAAKLAERGPSALPRPLRCNEAHCLGQFLLQQRAEAQDSFNYYQSADLRRAVEERRVLFSRRGYAFTSH